MRIKLLILSVCIMPFIYKTLPQILISMNYSLVIMKIGLQKPAQIADNTEFIGFFSVFKVLCEVLHLPSQVLCVL